MPTSAPTRPCSCSWGGARLARYLLQPVSSVGACEVQGRWLVIVTDAPPTILVRCNLQTEDGRVQAGRGQATCLSRPSITTLARIKGYVSTNARHFATYRMRGTGSWRRRYNDAAWAVCGSGTGSKPGHCWSASPPPPFSEACRVLHTAHQRGVGTPAPQTSSQQGHPEGLRDPLNA